MITIGLTGNIGAGKTTVSKILEDKGIPVFNSDLCARSAESDPEIRKKFIDIVGEEILVDGEIDRNKMREIVFKNKEILANVNALLKPYVIQKFSEFVKEQEVNGEIMVVFESAILFESGAANNFDHIITVVADKMTRAKRTMDRDNLTLDLVLAKMNAQLSDNYKIMHSDFVVINENMSFTDTKLLLEKQVDMILMLIMNTL